MCLARSAHGVAPNHPIFKGPHAVDIRYEDVPTPENYRRYIDGAELPDTIPVWHVDQADYHSADDLKPGTVSNGWGFEDSPDAEIIAHGINSKGPSAVALGRHGSLLLWGFAAEPARMTPSGQAAFLNSIHYIQRFDHEPRLVKGISRDRTWALQSAAKDPERLAAVRADLEYLRPDGRAWQVDADCKALGLSNRSVDTLEHCVDGLTAGQDTDRCRRILERYSGQSFEQASDWRQWLEDVREALFFSDVGGFRFFDSRAGSEASPPAGGTPPEGGPVGVAATLAPESARPGEVVTLTITVAHRPGWHTYASVAEGSAYLPTHIGLDLPDGWSTVGRWRSPAGHPFAEEPGTRVHEGVVRHVQRLRVGGTPEGAVHATVSYLACDEHRCLPPAEETLEVTLGG